MSRSNEVSPDIPTKVSGVISNESIHKTYHTTNPKLKEQSRDCLMEVLRDRQKSRKEYILRDLERKANLVASWDSKCAKENEEKKKNIFNRLTKAKQYYKDDEVLKINNQITEKIELAEERAKDNIKFKLEQLPQQLITDKLNKKNELQKREQEEVINKYKERQQKVEEALLKVNDEKMLKFQLTKERREKQILKSKVQIILAGLSKRSCHRFLQDYQRFTNAFDKDKQSNEMKFLSSNNTDDANRVNETEDSNEDPNTLLIQNLTNEEIELVTVIILS